MKFEDLGLLLTPESLPYLSGVERLPNGVLHVAVLTRMPGVLARSSFGRALALHCHEEMTTLAGFLPDLYASER